MDIHRLTLYSHGAGCGCKIAPDVLKQMLAGLPAGHLPPALLVGRDANDDAAVYDLGDGTAMISTTDFFMPIVDDPYDFGRIASANALSDVYAMGGQPLLAVALLGWPVQQLSMEMASEVLRGAQHICREAEIPLAGGHSIDSVEPFFGLAVTGRVPLSHLKRNNTARAGDFLYLTKPLGTGILTTAEKLDRLKPEDRFLARDTMIRLNRLGARLGAFAYVHAMTDVTGFGLLGHLWEVCDGSGLSAEIWPETLPVLGGDRLDYYISMQCVPAAAGRNWRSYQSHCSTLDPRLEALMCDPQTSGGLLVCVEATHAGEFEQLCLSEGWPEVARIGRLQEYSGEEIRIRTGKPPM